MVTRSFKCVDGYGSSNLNSESEFSYCSCQVSSDIFLSSYVVVVVVVAAAAAAAVVFSTDVCSV